MALFRRSGARMPGNLGMILLAVYLILVGLALVLGVSFNYMGVVQGILALAAGILILLGR